MTTKYKRLSHTVWNCTYHIIFCPKYRFKVLKGEIEVLVRNEIYRLCGRLDQIDVEEINIQEDHVHMIMSVPPKYKISSIMGYLKGKSSSKVFNVSKKIRNRYWGRHFWSRGYCVGTIGLNEDQIRKYVKWQQEEEVKG